MPAFAAGFVEEGLGSEDTMTREEFYHRRLTSTHTHIIITAAPADGKNRIGSRS
jgi:hypothetical protein